MAVIEVQGNRANDRRDEISRFQLGRYICTSEAYWRIFGFPIHDRYPAVQHLDIHLENGQREYFDPRRTNSQNLRNRDARKTTLTEFFALCERDAFARTLLYQDVPRYYTWSKNRGWSKRLRGRDVPNWDGKEADTLGRMFSIHPTNRECFYLRMLLTKVRGPTSFNFLRDGAESFHAACLNRGLLHADTQWESALEEAAATKMPAQVRSLFAVILFYCQPINNPMALWERFKNDLSEDILRQQNRVSGRDDTYNDLTYNQALIMLEDLLLNMGGGTLTTYNLPAPNRAHNDAFNVDILREREYDVQALFEQVEADLGRLTPDQRVAFDAIVEAVANRQGGLFFLDAPGGTGKTFLINLLLAQIRSSRKIAVAVASTGIAATLLAGGRTVHSTFAVPIDILDEQPTCKVSKQSSKGRMLRECTAIIWDECTMSHRKHLEAVDRLLKDMRNSNELMGGVVVVLAGDFRQTLPVVKHGTPADQLDASLTNSVLWRHVRKLRLTTNMRIHLRPYPEAEFFAGILLSIGEGKYPTPGCVDVTLTPSLCNSVDNVDQLINAVFPDLNMNLSDQQWLCERAILAPKNDTVDGINFSIQEKIRGNYRVYLSADRTVDPDEEVHLTTDSMNAFTPPNFPPHDLRLKVGAPIMLLRNLNPPKLCNGTRLCIKSFKNNLIEATIIVGPYKGEVVFIPRIPLISDDLGISFKRVQFPVRLAYAMTINKSQGQSLKVVGVDLSEPCFSHGQLYVACSRVGRASNMHILGQDGKTKNIVYPII